MSWINFSVKKENKKHISKLDKLFIAYGRNYVLQEKEDYEIKNDILKYTMYDLDIRYRLDVVRVFHKDGLDLGQLGEEGMMEFYRLMDNMTEASKKSKELHKELKIQSLLANVQGQ